MLTRDEAQAILAQLTGTPWLMVSLPYGAGLRSSECLSLRVKDRGGSGCLDRFLSRIIEASPG